MRLTGVLAFAALASSAAALAACDRAPPTDGLKEWTASDHDGEKKVGANQGPKGDGGGVPMLVEVTWKNQCQSCHGPGGRGDGPQGPMFKAADLGNDEWQSKVNDQDIAAVIVTGKGRMPKFELPEEIVKGLVARVRSFRGK
jgi:mono/diheme cytochrome c family protein